jgi:glycosyltransferase involved in cell wall biosynthesis
MSGRARILFTAPTGALTGGGQQSLLLLLQRIDRSIYEPLLACPFRGGLAGRAADLGVEILEITCPPLRQSSVAAFAACRRLLRDKRVDLVHTDHPRQTVYFGLASRMARLPLILHVRVSDSESRLYDRFLLMLATRVIAVSRAAAGRFSGMGGAAGKVSVIYNGAAAGLAATGEERARIRAELKIAEGDIVVGSAGQLVPKKGFELLIEAASILRERRPSVAVQYLIVGQGTNEYAEFLKARARERGLEARVTFTGFRDDLACLLAGTDIFVLASLYKEGLSRVIIEAMAAGLPVIAFDTGGNREVVVHNETGLLLEKGNTARLAEAMEKLVLGGTLRKTMGANGRERVRNNFNIDDNAEKIQKVYQEVLSNRKKTNGRTV